MAKEFLLLALGVVQVVIGEIGEFLPGLPFQLMLFTFELELIHGRVCMGLGLVPEQMELPNSRWANSFTWEAIAPLPKFGPEPGL